jgi:indolepyruvate decarboxylase
MKTSPNKTTIASYVARRLVDLGCKHVFGVPGTSCSDFYSAIEALDTIESIITTNELEAGYAADGYARFAGFGACCVSYGVGTLSLINAVAGCLVERVPMVVVNGGPSKKEIENQKRLGVLFSHSTGRPETDLRLFREVTVGTQAIRDGTDVPRTIDELFRTAKRDLGPVYLEIPNDLWEVEIEPPAAWQEEASKATTPEEARFVEAARGRIASASNPVILIGVEAVRRALRRETQTLIEMTGIPFATTVLSKSFLDEIHPLFRGTYDTDLVLKPARALLESSDCLVTLGCVFGVDHLTLVDKQHAQMIEVGFGAARIGSESFARVDLANVLRALAVTGSRSTTSNAGGAYPKAYLERRSNWSPAAARSEDAFGHEEIFTTVDGFLARSEESFLTVLDTCLGSFPGADLMMHQIDSYVANPVWLSIGHGTPAGVGAHFATERRPLILTGDGGFQMVAQALSTMVKHGISAIIIVIDNGAYSIEQYLIDSCYFVRKDWPLLPFVSLNPWKYERLPEAFGGFPGTRVSTREELESALKVASERRVGPFLIAAKIPSNDIPPENTPFARAQCKEGADPA